MMNEFSQDYSDFKLNIAESNKEKVLSQYQNSKILMAVMNAFSDEFQILADSLIDIMKVRSLGYAYGEHLDVIGRIIGCERGYNDQESEIFFRPDVQGLSVDQGILYCTNAPTDAGIYKTNDNMYLKKIWAHILCNFNKDSSASELTKIIYAMFGYYVGFGRTSNPFDVLLYVPDNISRYALNKLFEFVSDNYSQDIPTVPYPATLSLSGIVYYKPMVAFSTDMDGCGWDQGKASVATINN